ncbi:MAG: hypothetical protein WA020_07320 [Candidatus Acidiferrales bacterium]
MKRSGGVTAATVVLIVVSAVVCFGLVVTIPGDFMFRAIAPKMTHVFANMLAGEAVALAIAIWGVVTGVGLLRLRRWAWYCVLILSGLLVAEAIRNIVDARKFIRATTGVPTVGPQNMIAFAYFGMAIVTLVPLALGLWWLLLFTRRSVRAQFAPGVTLDTAYSQLAFVPSAPPLASGAQFTSPRTQLSYRRPVSITVIAVLLLAGAAAFPLFLFYPANWRVTALFGVVLTGRAVLAVLAFYSALGVVLGVGLLLLKPWARAAAILYAVVVTVNVAVSMRAQMRAVQMLQSTIGMPTLPGNQAQMFQRLMHVSMIVGVVFGVALNLVALYFLVTRRAAFYPPHPAPAISPQAAP